MNLKFDSTQFRCSLPGKVASSLHNYKIKQIGEHSVIVSTEKWETKFSMRPPIRTSTSPKCTQLTKVLPFPGMIRYNQESKHQVKRIKLWSFRHSWEMGKDFSKRGPSLPFKAKTRTHVDFSPQRNTLNYKTTETVILSLRNRGRNTSRFTIATEIFELSLFPL